MIEKTGFKIVIIRATMEIENSKTPKEEFGNEAIRIINGTIEKQNIENMNYEIISNPRIIKIYDGCADIFIEFIIKPFIGAIMGHLLNQAMKDLEDKHFKSEGGAFDFDRGFSNTCKSNRMQVYDEVMDVAGCVVNAHDCFIDAHDCRIKSHDCFIDAYGGTIDAIQSSIKEHKCTIKKN